MFLSENAAEAISNQLRLDFTRLQLTLSAGNLLSTEKGRGSVAPVADHFVVQFVASRKCPPNPDFLRHLLEAGEGRKLLLSGTESNGNIWHASADSVEAFRDGARSGFVLTTRELRKRRARSSGSPHIRMFFPAHPAQRGSRISVAEQKKRFPPIEFAGLQIEIVVWQDRAEVMVVGACSDEVAQKVVEAMSAAMDSNITCVFMEEQTANEQIVTVRASSEVPWLDVDRLSVAKLATKLKERFPPTRNRSIGTRW